MLPQMAEFHSFLWLSNSPLSHRLLHLFICLFVYGCVGSSLLRAGFL